MAAAMLQAKKQNAEFSELVDQNKAFQSIEKRKRKRAAEAGAITGSEELFESNKRTFRQTKSIGEFHRGTSKVEKSLLEAIVNNVNTQTLM